MREIKFRAWSPTAKEMFYQADQYLASFVRRFVTLETGDKTHESYLKYPGQEKVGIEPYLMQFTGLKDKNGTEIYEGDILKVHMRSKTIPRIGESVEFGDWYDLFCKVIFKPGMYYVEGVGEESVEGLLVTVEYQTKDVGGYLEVIGNIYENPDSLNQLQEKE